MEAVRASNARRLHKARLEAESKETEAALRIEAWETK